MTLTEFANLPNSRRRKYVQAADYIMEHRPDIINPVVYLAQAIFGK